MKAREKLAQLKLELYRQLLELPERDRKSWDQRLMTVLEWDPDVQNEVTRIIKTQRRSL